jgi:hypothetical protein
VPNDHVDFFVGENVHAGLLIAAFESWIVFFSIVAGQAAVQSGRIED